MNASKIVDQPAVERVHPPNWLMRLINPVMRWLIKQGKPKAVADRVGLLRFRGHKTGELREIPAGVRTIRGQLATLTNSSWRVNFRGGRDLVLVHTGTAHDAHGTLLEDPHEVAMIYQELIAELGADQAGRELGIRTNVDREPTRAELRAMIERSGLSVLWYELDPDRHSDPT